MEVQLFFVGDRDHCDRDHDRDRCYSTKKAFNGWRDTGKYAYGFDGCGIIFNAHVILLTK